MLKDRKFSRREFFLHSNETFWFYWFYLLINYTICFKPLDFSQWILMIIIFYLILIIISIIFTTELFFVFRLKLGGRGHQLQAYCRSMQKEHSWNNIYSKCPLSVSGYPLSNFTAAFCKNFLEINKISSETTLGKSNSEDSAAIGLKSSREETATSTVVWDHSGNFNSAKKLLQNQKSDEKNVSKNAKSTEKHDKNEKESNEMGKQALKDWL